MLLQNAMILDGNFTVTGQDLIIEDGKIAAIGKGLFADEAIDLNGGYLVPGFIDLHIHGYQGINLMEADQAALDAFSLALAKEGVTGFAATTVTLEEERILSALRRLSRAAKKGLPGAQLLGIYLEGPFLSHEKKGAMKESCLLPPDIETMKRYLDAADGLIKLVTLAPELPCAAEFTAFCKENGVTVSLGHTASDFETAAAGFSFGISHATHLYNAMSAFGHRDPGAVGAVFDSIATAELICDGFHVHPAAVRTAYRQLGPSRLCLISDGTMLSGLPDGRYEMDGQISIVKDHTCRLETGVINGNANPLSFCVKQAVRFGIPFGDAVRMASFTPASVLGLQKQTGRIAVGMDADLVVLDKEYHPCTTFIKGRQVSIDA